MLCNERLKALLGTIFRMARIVNAVNYNTSIEPESQSYLKEDDTDDGAWRNVLLVRASVRDRLRHGQYALISTLMRPRYFRIFAQAATFFLLLVGTGSGQNTPLSSLDQAIDLALAHNHSIKATRTLILQNQAQEITANLRPNPTLGADSQFVPFFSPQDFSGENLNQTQQFDIGIGYLFERGHKRQRRLQAPRDQTAVTRVQVPDAERTLAFNVGQQFVSVLLAESTLQFALQDLQSFQQTVD